MIKVYVEEYAPEVQADVPDSVGRDRGDRPRRCVLIMPVKFILWAKWAQRIRSLLSGWIGSDRPKMSDLMPLYPLAAGKKGKVRVQMCFCLLVTIPNGNC